MNTKISIIIPIYNSSKTLNECISCILAQSYTSFELILVNDGSTDNSGEICDLYAKTDPRIIVIHKVNEGVSIARNTGIKRSTGKYITFIDSDDTVSTNYLLNLIEIHEKLNAELTISGFVKRNQGIDKPHYIDYNGVVDIKTIGSILNNNIISVPFAKIFNSDIIKTNRIIFPNGISRGEDTIFVLEYILHIDKIVLLPEYSYFYITTENSLMTKLNSVSSELSCYNILNNLCNNIIQKYNLKKERRTFLIKMQLDAFERVIRAIMNIPNRNERIGLLNSLDYSYYLRHKKGNTWKESILTIILRLHFFRIYDLLITKYA